MNTVEPLSATRLRNIGLLSRRRGSANRSFADYWDDANPAFWTPFVFRQGEVRSFEFTALDAPDVMSVLSETAVMDNLPFMEGFEYSGAQHQWLDVVDALTLDRFFIDQSALAEYLARVTTLTGVFQVELTLFTYPAAFTLDTARFRGEVSSAVLRMMANATSYARADVQTILSRNLYDIEGEEYFAPNQRRQRANTRNERYPTIAIPLGVMDSPQLDYQEFTQWLLSRLSTEDINTQPERAAIEYDETPEDRVTLRTAQLDLERSIDRQMRANPFWTQTVASANERASAPQWSPDFDEETEEWDDDPS